jgi:O-antigen ligase
MPTATATNNKKTFDRNQLLYVLLCCYVFFVPFEDLLEYLYGIDTIFKPYRLFGLLILAFGFFHKFREKPFFVYKPDKIVTFFLFYGVMYTIVLYLIGKPIAFGSFISSNIQILFLFLIFLTFKRVDLTYRQLETILMWLVAGIIINGLIIVMDFYVLQISTREKGLSNNPNYAAFGLVIATAFLVYRLLKNQFRIFHLKNVFYFACITAAFFSILATGSRSGFLLLMGSLGLHLVILTNNKIKIQLIPLAVIILAIVLQNAKFNELTESSATFSRLEHATEDIRVPLAKAGFIAIKDSKGMGVGVSQMLNRATFIKYMNQVDRNLVFITEERNKGLGLHNLYIEVAVETGFIGLSLWLLYIFIITKNQWKEFRRGGKHQSTHRFLLVAFICLTVYCLGGKGILGALFWFIIALASRTYRDDEPTPELQPA